MNFLIILFQNTVFQTVISGVLIFVFGQVIQKFFLESVQKYRSTIGKIDNKLKLYADVITSPGIKPEENQFLKERYLECSDALRNLSCELEENYKQIPLRKIIKSEEKISEVARHLIGLSNSVFHFESRDNNNNSLEKIREYLKIQKL